MQLFRRNSALSSYVATCQTHAQTIGLVPTMGALHPGHISLVQVARKHADIVMVSIFVNPTQFAAHEDFGSYPRNEAQDLALLAKQGVDAVYIPDIQEIYPEQVVASIDVGSLGAILEGVYRPHFFSGVATIVDRLLYQTQCDNVIFGEKDYQQLCVIKQIVAPQHPHTNIIAAPTIREEDGLAYSSRNIYLTESERKQAPALYATLQYVYALLKQNNTPETACMQGASQLIQQGFASVDYLSLHDTQTLSPATEYREGNQRLLVAATLGATRLIDNILV